MKTKYIIFLSTLLSVSLSAQKIEFDGMRYRGEVIKEYNVSEKGSLVMDNIRGDVQITGEARNTIQVREKFSINAYSESDAEKIYNDYRAKYILKGNSLTIEGQDYSRRYQSDFTIRVPGNFNLNVSSTGGDIITETVTGDVRLKTSGGDVDILQVYGNLVVKTSGGDISIRKANADIEAVTSGGEVTLEQISGELFSKTSGGDISLQQFSGNGEIRTSGGDIYIARVKGKRLVGHTSGGDIGADDVRSDVDLTTSGGDISIGRVSANALLHTSGGSIDIKEINGHLDASASGGDIDIRKVDGACILSTSGGDISVDLAGDKLDAKTSGGDIYLSKVYGAIRAHTSGGDIEVRKELVKSIKDNSVNLSTSGGDIFLNLPDNIKANVFAQITVYNRWDNSEIRSDFPLEITKEKRGSKLIITGRGAINGGGDDVILKTSGGNIRLDRDAQ